MLRGVALSATQDGRAVALRARGLRVRPVLLALALNAAAIAAFGVYLSTGGAQVAVPAARACGLGDTPTMLADKDTIIVPKKSTIDLAARFEVPGTWMYHCHILEHAENGMMGMLEAK